MGMGGDSVALLGLAGGKSPKVGKSESREAGKMDVDGKRFWCSFRVGWWEKSESRKVGKSERRVWMGGDSDAILGWLVGNCQSGNPKRQKYEPTAQHHQHLNTPTHQHTNTSTPQHTNTPQTCTPQHMNT
jgi:hypothetical protein